MPRSINDRTLAEEALQNAFNVKPIRRSIREKFTRSLRISATCDSSGFFWLDFNERTQQFTWQMEETKRRGTRVRRRRARRQRQTRVSDTSHCPIKTAQLATRRSVARERWDWQPFFFFFPCDTELHSGKRIPVLCVHGNRPVWKNSLKWINRCLLWFALNLRLMRVKTFIMIFSFGQFSVLHRSF